MKGREAVRAANRRTAEATEEAAALRAELAQERADRKEETTALRSEVKRLKADHMAEASRLATEEVARRLAQLEEERRAKGLSRDFAQNSLVLKDKFVRNACRYVSMTRGMHPVDALEMVMTWMTDEDFYGFSGPDVLVKLGLPLEGWAGRLLRLYKHDTKRVARWRKRNDAPAAVSLDRAEKEGNSNIHPGYKSSWYPPVHYSGMEIVDEPSTPALPEPAAATA